MHGVERMEWDAVYRTPFFIFRAIFDFNTVGVVRADLVQRNQVRNDQSNQYQRDGNDVKGKETVERGVRKDRKSTRLNSSHVAISYAVFCLKKKTTLKRICLRK